MNDQNDFTSRPGGRPFVVYGVRSEPLAKFIRSFFQDRSEIYSQWKEGVLIINGCVISLMTTLDEWQPYHIYAFVGAADDRTPAQREEDNQLANRPDAIYENFRDFIGPLFDEDYRHLHKLLEEAMQEGRTRAQTLLDHAADDPLRCFFPAEFC